MSAAYWDVDAVRAVTSVLVAGIVALGGCVAGVPLLALASGGFDAPEDECPSSTADGSPGILGPSALTAAELRLWWTSRVRSQPARLDLPVAEVIDLYLGEADAEGVRGDIAFAQAVFETGWFGSDDTSRHNFAGIAHYDGRGSGTAFPDVATGVRAHIQLLKKYAEGNDVRLRHPDVAPAAGARATSWAQLAGTWATAPNYWTEIESLYRAMLATAGRGTGTVSFADCLPADQVAGPVGGLVRVRGITVDASIAAPLERLLEAARQDGLTLTGGGYRTHARQIELRRAHCGSTHYAIHEMPAGQCSPPTARPGTSRHEEGLAIDFNNCSTRSTRCYRWLATNAAAHGFHNLPSEPWHWSIDGS